MPLVTDSEPEPRRSPALSPVSSSSGLGSDPTPAGPPPADLLPPRPSGGRWWEQAAALPPSPRRLPPGRHGHWAQVSCAAGSSASSHPCLCGARGRVTPQGPPVRMAGRRVAVWLQVGLDAISCFPRRLGRSVSCSDPRPAPSQDPWAHPPRPALLHPHLLWLGAWGLLAQAAGAGGY